MKKRAFRKLYKKLFYTQVHEKITDKFFWCRMTLSVLMILACTGVITASTFALFYTDISSDNSTIAGAYFSVKVSNTNENTVTAALAYDDMHKFFIKAAGTASVGYCRIDIGENVYYTKQIQHNSVMEITIQAAKGSVIEFTPCWGALPNGVEIFYGNSDSISPLNLLSSLDENSIIRDSLTPHAVYTVEPAAKLKAIADYYGVPEADIIVYNNLPTSADTYGNVSAVLTVGNEIKIPGESAVIKHAEATYSVPFVKYVIEPTAKISDIALYYGVPAEDVIAFNPSESFVLGGEIKIPYAAERAVPYAVPFATYKIEPTAKLENIAAHYGISEADILAYNRVSEIQSGLELKIPGVASNTEAYAVPFTTYHIEPTARLYAISAFYGVSVSDILEYNGLAVTDYIIAGTDLKIPSPNQTQTPYSVPYVSYKVEVTAKIESIAAHYGVSQSEILRFNNIDNISVGSELKIPYPTTSEPYAVPYATYVIPEGATLENIAKYYGASETDILAFNPGVEIKTGATVKIPGIAADTAPYLPPVISTETSSSQEPSKTLAETAN